ncbi:glycosyltransferase family 2 protein [Tenacibaculum sp. MAR_2009_124]|uniref:glycosyltransferase family 2 protein n=1 Tax=Tenacibaculum sp. MAR_2009_124 TaxID=1250059 RepID=UPI000A566A53|nr:glycosyltransferase family 2 protein [Tenacibaculum sp. MAR_2009_124]
MKHTINIELYVLCFNEQKMIRHTLNYYSKFCSKIVIIDNQSTDDSIELASKYEHVEFRYLDSDNEFVEDKLRETRNNCWKGSVADYVIVCDMDEFLYDENLMEKLTLAKQRNIVMPMIVGYNMINDNFPLDYDSLITTQIKFGKRSNWFDKNIIFDPKKVKEINFSPGSHQCYPVFYENTITDELLELKLLHYKYLGREYLYKKHKDYVNRMSAISKEKKHGYEYLDGEKHIDNVFDSSNYITKIIN